jgi:hypothetical protein
MLLLLLSMKECTHVCTEPLDDWNMKSCGVPHHVEAATAALLLLDR